MAANWPRSSADRIEELSAGKLGSSTGVDISNLWFVFRRPSSTPARQHKPGNVPCPHYLKKRSVVVNNGLGSASMGQFLRGSA